MEETAVGLFRALRKWRPEAEGGVCRLKALGLLSRPQDVLIARAERGGVRRRLKRLARKSAGEKPRGEESHRGRLDVALDAGDLSGQLNPRARLELQLAAEQAVRLDVRVAMDRTEAHEL